MHYESAPCFEGEHWLPAETSRGFAPAPPGFSALVPLPIGILEQRKGMPKHPLGSVEATESALGLPPGIALSSAQSVLILLRRERSCNFAGSFDWRTLNLEGKWSS